MRFFLNCLLPFASVIAAFAAPAASDVPGAVQAVVLDLDDCYMKEIFGGQVAMCRVIEHQALMERANCKQYCPSWENLCLAGGPDLASNDAGASSSLEAAWCKDQCDTVGTGCARKRDAAGNVDIGKRANCSRSNCQNICRQLGSGRPGVAIRWKSFWGAVATGVALGACAASCSACTSP